MVAPRTLRTHRAPRYFYFVRTEDGRIAFSTEHRGEAYRFLRNESQGRNWKVSKIRHPLRKTQ